MVYLKANNSNNLPYYLRESSAQTENPKNEIPAGKFIFLSQPIRVELEIKQSICQ